MQTCIMSSLPRCIFRCSVFRYVTLVSFFFCFVFFKLCYLIVTLLLWWRINTYLLTYLHFQAFECHRRGRVFVRCARSLFFITPATRSLSIRYSNSAVSLRRSLTTFKLPSVSLFLKAFKLKNPQQGH